MSEELKWLLGIAATVTLGALGFLINAFNNLSTRQKVDNDAIHSRINDVKDNYVKRSDLEAHMHRLEKSMDDVRDGVKETNATLLKLHEQQGRIVEMGRVASNAAILNSGNRGAASVD